MQQNAWRTISTYSQWDDGLPRSIVLSTATGPAYRLAANWESSVWSSLSWVAAASQVSLQLRQFQFEMVVSSRKIPAPLLGAVYRIWLWGTTSCLLDYALGTDQLVYLGASLATPTALVMIEIASDFVDISIEDCGLFYVADAYIRTCCSSPSVSLYVDHDTAHNSIATLQQNSTHVPVVTTPSIYQDATAGFVYSLDPSAIANCRQLYCMIDQILGACSTAACAANVVGDDMWNVCKPCIAAHVPFAIM
jgi:hypothetical protein